MTTTRILLGADGRTFELWAGDRPLHDELAVKSVEITGGAEQRTLAVVELYVDKVEVLDGTVAYAGLNAVPTDILEAELRSR